MSKKAKSSSSSGAPQHNIDILHGLERLSTTLAALDDTKSSPKLSHYGTIPIEVSQAYDMIFQGASLVHGTSTKYTLMGRISIPEQEKIASDLLKGCQLISTGALVLCNDPNSAMGICRSAKHYVKQTSRSIVATTSQLVESFAIEDHQQNNEDHHHDETVGGAPRTGAVWQTCNVVLDKKLPLGNRNAMRRDLFTWMMECKETMDEFQELIDEGPAPEGEEEEQQVDGDDDDDGFEAFLTGQMDQQYTSAELPIAQACVLLVKCSKNNLNATLQACEAVNKQVAMVSGGGQRQCVLQWISKIHDLARDVGEGMTDLGALLYPPLKGSLDQLKDQFIKQENAIITLLDFILDATATYDNKDEEEEVVVINLDLPESVIEMANKQKGMAQTRQKQVLEAIQKCS